MARVTVFGDFEKALRRFKKKCINEGIVQEIREREYFEKPSAKRKKAKAQAVSRWKKKLRESKAPKSNHFG